MKILLSAYAKLELDDAVNYLELEFEGLGYRFKAEVKAALKRMPAIQPLGVLSVGK